MNVDFHLGPDTIPAAPGAYVLLIRLDAPLLPLAPGRYLYGDECALVRQLAAFPVPWTGFGSSDCRTCASHLLAWPDGRALPWAIACPAIYLEWFQYGYGDRHITLNTGSIL